MITPTLLDALALKARIAPTQPCLLLCGRAGVVQVTYGELAVAVDRWALILQDFKPEIVQDEPAVVFIVAGHCLDTYASFLGAMRAGMIACFIPGPTPKQDPAIYWSSHQAVMARVCPVAVVSRADLQPQLRSGLGSDVTLIAFDRAGEPPCNQLPPLSQVTRDATPAVLQHSSGTTGLKKGVLLTHGQIKRQVDPYAASLRMTGDDIVASWLPLYHDMGLVTGFLMPLSLGATVVAMDPFDWLARPDYILEVIRRFRASFCWMPNFAFAHLVNTADQGATYDISSIRAFIDCSEPCRADTLSAFSTRFASSGLKAGAIATCYAMAETVFAVTQTSPGSPPRVLAVDTAALSDRSEVLVVMEGGGASTRLVSCGPPIRGTSVRIKRCRKDTLPKEALPLQNDGSGIMVGEIQVASGSAFAGYYGDPEASAACLDGAWYSTGDLGFIHNGEIYVSGRLKDLIIVNGRNFYAHDIEAVVSGVPGIKPGRAVAFAVRRAAAGSDGAVVLAESKLAEPDKDRILARMISKTVFDVLGLTLHHVGIRPPGVLVKTSSGKLSRSENGRRFAAESCL